MRVLGSARKLQGAVAFGLFVAGVAVFGDLDQRVHGLPVVGQPVPPYGQVAAGLSRSLTNGIVQQDGALEVERTDGTPSPARAEAAPLRLEAARTGRMEAELSTATDMASDKLVRRPLRATTHKPEATVIAGDPDSAVSEHLSETALSKHHGFRQGERSEETLQHRAGLPVRERAEKHDDGSPEPPCNSGRVPSKRTFPPSSAAPSPPADADTPGGSQKSAYILRLQGTGAVEVSFEVGRAVKQLEGARKAYRDASAKLEAEEVASGAKDLPGAGLGDYLKDTQKRAAAAFQQSKIKQKLEEIEELLQLARALKDLNIQLRACQGLPGADPLACEKAHIFGEIVAQKAKYIQEQAPVLSSFLGREPVDRHLRRAGGDTPGDAVEAEATELQQALRNAVVEARKFVRDIAGDVGGDVREEVQQLLGEAKEVLIRGQQVVLEAYKALQRSLLEDRTKELIAAASKKIEDARRILAE
ncbi:putative 3-methyl-adenine DNA glycosylase [Besnoitia besnoiti]|uniref:Putative 3-methyl-adenine DNA glycosylase n=1 Tax=Besnoitia besnoiti TaxID=94643 RepID=A0A2A9MCH6_BESBE|nr:putative 3-methyl-adenine DNA glycosylase [Besnoitia besnoiti]PFH35685.1 putative 3-methyl-adenine DNA glycosylase [Besnoitia besnoiti]